MMRECFRISFSLKRNLLLINKYENSSVIEKSTVNLNISFSNVATGLYDVSVI